MGVRARKFSNHAHLLHLPFLSLLFYHRVTVKPIHQSQNRLHIRIVLVDETLTPAPRNPTNTHLREILPVRTPTHPLQLTQIGVEAVLNHHPVRVLLAFSPCLCLHGAIIEVKHRRSARDRISTKLILVERSSAL